MAEPLRPLRILQALSVSTIGGTERMVMQLLLRSDRSLVMNHVSFLDATGPVAKCLAGAKIPVYGLQGKAGIVSCLIQMLKIFRAHHYDIVHLYGFRVSLIGRLAARLVRPRPVVIHGIRGLHVTEGEETSSRKTKIALAIERLGAPLVDAYVANSHGAVNFLCNHGLPRNKFTVISNGIDVSEWHKPFVRPPRETSEVICVANFRPRKRQDDLVEALRLLQTRGVKVRCLFVGDGPTRQAVESFAKSLHLDGIAEFVGRREPKEVRVLLGRADIFVLPSLWEGLPGSVMEAMAAGLPVVGTDVNGTNELVIEGGTGFLVPPGNPEALAERLASLTKNPQIRHEMGQRGRKRIAEEFTLDAMVKRTEMLYRSLMETRQPSS